MKNIAASVRSRLANQARANGVTLDSLIERFAIGRLLWRLSRSKHADCFILKGAQLFTIWADNLHRPTRDLDFLGMDDPSIDSLVRVFGDLLEAPVDPDDGLVWGKVDAAPIREDQRYGGIRIVTKASLAGARVRIQIDIGFGDAVTPIPEEHSWPELLNFPEARLLTYPPETVIAENFRQRWSSTFTIVE